MSSCLILIPLLSALIGWLTITLTVRLILMYLRQYQTVWANQLGNALLTDLMPIHEIVGGLGSVDVSDRLEGLLSDRIQSVLNRFKETTPMVGMFLNDTLSAKIKSMVVEEIKKEWPAMQKSMTEAVMDKFDLRTLVASKLAAIQPETIERALQTAAGKQLQQLALAAAALGLVIGLIQAGIVAWCYA